MRLTDGKQSLCRLLKEQVLGSNFASLLPRLWFPLVSPVVEVSRWQVIEGSTLVLAKRNRHIEVHIADQFGRLGLSHRSGRSRLLRRSVGGVGRLRTSGVFSLNHTVSFAIIVRGSQTADGCQTVSTQIS